MFKTKVEKIALCNEREFIELYSTILCIIQKKWFIYLLKEGKSQFISKWLKDGLVFTTRDIGFCNKYSML